MKKRTSEGIATGLCCVCLVGIRECAGHALLNKSEHALHAVCAENAGGKAFLDAIRNVTNVLVI
jgi:hypothetical protein